MKKSLYLCSPMCSLESYKIDLKGLTQDLTVLEYDLDDAFFRAVDAPEVSRGRVHVSLSIRKASGFFELSFHCEGIVTVACNRCLDDMELPVTADHQLVARLGSAYSEDDDHVTVDEHEGVLDVSWYIYELIALAIPIQHVHESGQCNEAMIHALEEHSVDRNGTEDAAQPLDPRWEALLKLKK